MRHARELKEGARYHVTARANRKGMILDTSAMKELFLSVVKRAKMKYDFRLENFCIMGNHFHFVIQPGRGESLSAIMRWIMSVFAMAYNKIRGLHRTRWGCRFFSRIIAPAQKTGFAGAAGVQGDPLHGARKAVALLFVEDGGFLSRQ
jgi:putative transposase